ncbi:class I SAM-dependent methyltransferase [Cellulomonas sp. zg-ZUI199]|uniref:Class I SAM-dependent methyltransferase n=1 Tax=Cellulomonas wangleii TaxID=2816956 RepID=A0ABX8D348_9CELL|nr:class I SAM-dependent methyltransferase [Cellulomonas wangleii]MBO0926554.1 class I SAM-dependent methyltransferase [Cellulomonas wangleii]QVI60881.1 class I SAM-dependent methyltransferase [Cellulomonas wangleii]
MSEESPDDALAAAGYLDVPDDQGGRAARGWWDANAQEYLDEHGAFLGPADLLWCPEGLRESDAHLLGDVRGARVLELGAGAAQGTRWLRTQAGADGVATDVSAGMLAAARRLDAQTGTRTPLVQADARALPFASASFDVAFTAFGALPFVPDAARVHAEVARVLRPGGRWVFSVTHPVRWAFPDDPGEGGLTATRSYFDRRPYVEQAADGRVLYAEYHRTLADHVGDVVGAGLVVDGLLEPEWPAGHHRVWGGWGPVRGARLPGTLIVRAHRPPA